MFDFHGLFIPQVVSDVSFSFYGLHLNPLVDSVLFETASEGGPIGGGRIRAGAPKDLSECVGIVGEGQLFSSLQPGRFAELLVLALI